MKAAASKVPLQVAFSVPKRKFRRAVDRNRLKRLMRESHRLHKHQLTQLLQDNSESIIGMWVYTASDPVEYKIMEKGVKKVFSKLADVLF